MLFGMMIASAAIELSNEDLDSIAGGNIADVEVAAYSSERNQLSSLFATGLAGIISGTQASEQQVNGFSFKDVNAGN
ncbi:CTB family bacteriocin [Calothrix sp. PCC 6303]|uniref:CTB family bacteriocin n=1 Tax=Calothrix sp. PCC 6303 TaxID=1170562 RepID=UPI0002A0518D|nr:CTB family bacteriocin [Calothrix sp. PCC 6303]AFZ02191.1 hypothetical protein Cal6303_3250 [Calothrix sp. PCC 6303]